MALSLSQLPLTPSLSTAIITNTISFSSLQTFSLSFHHNPPFFLRQRRSRSRSSVFAGGEDTELSVTSITQDVEPDPDPQDLKYVSQIKRVLELLRKNRDMLFSEVKLTVMIEDPREVERRRLLGIDDADAPTRDDLAAVLEEVNEGKIPQNRVALQMLAEEMIQWPNLEVEVQKKGPRKSLYAKATDTGVDPQVAAKRLNIDWDSAAEIEDADSSDDSEVPSALGYGALYLVTAFPVIIGVVRCSNGAYDKIGDVFISVENLEDLEEPKMLIDGSLKKEKQISVDPMLMKESENSCLSLPPPGANGMFRPLPLLPTKYKFLSSSLPNSASSSPRFSSGLLRGKGKNQNQAVSPSISSLARQHSIALLRLAQLRESHLQRSKSCGEGRAYAPSDDFDLLFTTASTNGHENRLTNTSYKAEATARMYGHNGSGKEILKSYHEEFKCGALCLFLPGFGKGKPVRGRKEEPEMAHVVSRTVSLEKFKCGSWTSSAIVNDHEEDGDSSNLYFDLPLELIRSSVNDANSPVSSAFVFDKDRKGVLRNGMSTRGVGRKSHESSCHVRFSTSSPTTYPTSPSSCITPRLRKARDDFNAFLEAQRA